MNKNQIITIAGTSGLAWQLPLPTWPVLKIGTRPLRYTYTLSNQSDAPIQIKSLGLEPGNDDRIGLVDGTAYAGLILAPQVLS